MAYAVDFNVPDRPLANGNISFTVKSDGKLLGTLFVSKGALAWKRYYGKHTFKMDWQKFSALMEDEGTKGPGK